MNTQTLIKVGALGAVLISLTSCAAVSNEVNHEKLNVQSDSSKSIFLDPMDENQQTIFVQVKNTTTQNMSGLTSSIKKQLTDGGWTVVRNPATAHDLLQVNVLQFGPAKNSDEVRKAVASGFGSLIVGALAGVGAGYLYNNNIGNEYFYRNTGNDVAIGAGVGLGVASASWVANEAIQDKTYSIITDVQLSVRNKDNSWKKYNNRIASMADKVNLKPQEATPVIIQQQAKEIAGIFIADGN